MSHVDIRFADKNSERYMLARRIYKVIEDLENEYLYPDSETLGGFKFRDGQYKFHRLTRANGLISTRRTITGATERTMRGSATASSCPSASRADRLSIS